MPWELDPAKILIIAVTAASPIGEILIAIPLGVALGIDPFTSFAIAFPSNMAPAAAILTLLDLLERRYPSIARYFARRGVGLVERFGARKIQIVIVAITPLAGVYAVSFATKILGVDRKASLACQSTGVALYGAAEALLISLGLSIPRIL